MHVYPIEKLIHLKKNTPDGITAIYINTTLRTLALSLVGIFVPVFIFMQTQETFGEGIAIGLYGVAIYYLVWRLIVVLMVIPASSLVSKIGFRWCLLLSSLSLAILLFLFSLVTNNFWVLGIAVFVHAIQTSLYWLSYRSLFVKDGIMGHLGEEVGTNAILAKFAAIGGPALGGLIIAVWGFSYLFWIALVIVLISGLPYFFMRYHERNSTATLSSVIKWLKVKEHRNEEVSFIGRNIEGFISTTFWPIFVFLIVGAYEKQGLVASLGLVVGAITTLFAGRMFDRKRSLKAFRFGVIWVSIMYFVRIFVNTLGKLVMVQIANDIASPFYWITFDSLVYERAREEDGQVLTFMVSRMIMVSVALIAVMGFAILVAKYDWRFSGMWIFASIATLFTLTMWEGKYGKQK
ncbi:hypothetical protein ACFL0F_02045 [Patescibacteria group bacterium]